MNLFAKILKMRRNNRGESLVEVIVAMLILTIIVIPLLNSFGVTGRINLKARNVQYATNVATNVLEGLKEYGISGSAMQFYEFEPFRIIADTGEISLDYSESLSDFATPLIYGSDANPVSTSVIMTGPSAHGFKPRLELDDTEENKEYNENYAHKYYFYIKNIKEGTKYYDAHITLDASNYTPEKLGLNEEGKSYGYGFNTFDMADLTTLNSRYSVVASPSGVYYQTIGEGENEQYDSSKTPQTEAVRVFQERYGVHMQNVYDTEVELTQTRNSLIYEAVQSYINNVQNAPLEFDNYMENVTLRHAAYSYYITHYADEYQHYLDQNVSLDDDPIIIDVTTLEVGDSFGVNDLSEQQRNIKFTNHIKRTTTITITWDDTDTKHPYVVNSKVTFTFDTPRFLCDVNDPDDLENASYVCEGYFAPDTHFEAIDNIYIFQDARLDAYGLMKEDTVEIDYSGLGNKLIKASDGEDSHPGLFIVWQYELLNPEDLGMREPEFNRSGDTIDILFTGSRTQANMFTLYSTENMGLNTPKIQEVANSIRPEDIFISAKDGSIVADRDFKDRFYDIIVEVTEHDSSEVLFTLNTTVKE